MLNRCLEYISSAGTRELKPPPPNTCVRPYNGYLGAKPLAGFRGRAPGQGNRRRSPPKAETFLAFGRSLKAANLPTLKKLETQKNHIQFVLFFSNDVYRLQYVTD